MANEMQAGNVFEIENCRAENGAAGLTDCLASKQAHLCGFSLPFGAGYFASIHAEKNLSILQENCEAS